MTRLTGFNEISDDAPRCPIRGCNGRPMTDKEIAAEGCDVYVAQPNKERGEYWACCIVRCNFYIHMPRRER